MTNGTQTFHAADERRYTPQELALLWQCSTDVVYDLLRAGKLVGFKVGSSWRIRHSEVLNYESDPRNHGGHERPPTPTPTAVRKASPCRVY